MLQITTQLSAASRITSSSYSFHPAIDFSTRISPIGRRGQTLAGKRSSSSSLLAIPVPAPPRMKLGRMMTGNPMRWAVEKGLIDVVGEARFGHRETDLGHGIFELLAVFGGVDRFGPRPNHFDPKALELPAPHKLHREVERRLATQRRQQGVGPLLFDDVDQDVGVERLDVRRARPLRGRS